MGEGNFAVSSSFCAEGDAIILSGTLGDHHATILSARMGIVNDIASDCAPLHVMASALANSGLKVKSMRDVTRGGLATVLHEFAVASKACIRIEEMEIPVRPQVRGLTGILGLDPLYMANEGKMVAVVAKEDANEALELIRKSPYGAQAAIIGTVISGDPGALLLHTTTGGTRTLTELYGEGLPRIC